MPPTERNDEPLCLLREAVERLDTDAALDALDRACEAGAVWDEVLAALTLPAAQTLQLYYPTPHAMIALEWTRAALGWLDEGQKKTLVRACLRCVADSPKVGLAPLGWLGRGEPHLRDLAEGLRRALGDRRAYDACFYADRLLSEGREEDLRRLLMRFAANEVDALGHVFIYAATALRLHGHAEASDRNAVLLALMEFLARKASPEPSRLDRSARSFDDLLPEAFEKINILGHNVIYAAELRAYMRAFPEDVREHLLAQLARNIADSETTLTRREAQASKAAAKMDTPPADRLRFAFETQNLPEAYGAVADALDQGAAFERFRAETLVLFARIAREQPHYIIYPAATFMLLGDERPPWADMALAQLAKMGVEAAGRHGLRPRR